MIRLKSIKAESDVGFEFLGRKSRWKSPTFRNRTSEGMYSRGSSYCASNCAGTHAMASATIQDGQDGRKEKARANMSVFTQLHHTMQIIVSVRSPPPSCLSGASSLCVSL